MELERNSQRRAIVESAVRSETRVEDRSPDQKPRTLIVSDVRLYREGLALTLSTRPDLEFAGAVGSLDGALDCIEAAPTVVVLDTGMPKALEVARAIMRAAPSTKIVAVAVAEDAEDVVACAEAGMAGYVSRDGSIEDVAAAIHGVVRGEISCSPRMVSTLFQRLASRAPDRAENDREEQVLTKREVEIVALIDEGMSNKEIGRRLRIGTTTVKNHVHHILDKLSVRRRGQAAAAVRATQSVPSLSVKRRRGDAPQRDQRM